MQEQEKPVEQHDATPLMRQYFEIKQQYPDTLLLFQVGDFYELFFDDAKTVSAFLGIALTKRGTNKGEPIPLCGVPLHALEHYLIKLIKGGFRAAICNQLEEPRPGKVVKRGVTQVLTPGTLTDERLLNEKQSSYIAACYCEKKDSSWAVVFLELLTGLCRVVLFPSGSEKSVEEELLRSNPSEIIFSQTSSESVRRLCLGLGIVTTTVDDLVVHEEYEQWLAKQFSPELLRKVVDQEPVYRAICTLFCFLFKNQPAALSAIQSINWYSPEQFLVMDMATQRNLELVVTAQGSVESTLFALMDQAMTPMGSRRIKQWLVRPLKNKEALLARQESVAFFVHHSEIQDQFRQRLALICDIERVVGRIALQRGQLHDYRMLIDLFEQLPEIRQLLSVTKIPLLLKLVVALGEYRTLQQLLVLALNTDRTKEWIIRPGFDQRLDYLRDLLAHGGQKILELEQAEQQKTGITSLKIRYNHIQGYYIEVTKPNLALVPDSYQHLQTLVGKSRFTTPELKALEADLVKAEREIASTENEAFDRIKREVSLVVTSLRVTAYALSQLDALCAFGYSAYQRGYVRPEFNDSNDIIIEQGQHPVVSNALKHGFVPNDTRLTDDQSLWIITGPNMGGKSTYLRQVALLSVMAQTGSFIPAQRAQLPLLDQIFTRIGASDNLAEGKSTFLIEMEETATICRRANEKSLVILDEVGRGTSTFDGLAIAHAVVEYIFRHVKARCLFATHYHELTMLEQHYQGIVCYHATSRQTRDGIIFLHQILPGVADGSFGLEVAKLAGLPPALLERAHEVLLELQQKETSQVLPPNDQTIRMEALERELQTARIKLARLDTIDFDNLTPKKALDFLWELK
jgi:DNA mismatch repair protein MutS